ncbi:zwilch kinetochore protein isoform X3 [Amblyomma americanum]
MNANLEGGGMAVDGPQRRAYHFGKGPRCASGCPPPDYTDKVLSFQKYVIGLRREQNYIFSQIANTDQTPVWFDCPERCTVELKGKKSVFVRTTGAERQRFTVMLCVTADGWKLPPYVILKRKTIPKGVFPKGIVVCAQEKGWMDDELVLGWVKSVWEKRPGAMLARRSLLVLDSFRGHLTGRVRERLRGIRTDMAVIPGGFTGMLQPLDVSVNRPFKVEFRRQYSEMMANGNHDETPTGRLKRAVLATVLGWILSAWNFVSTDIVTRSFKVTGISSSLDGTEDDFLWAEHLPEHSTSSESEDSQLVDCLSTGKVTWAPDVNGPSCLDKVRTLLQGCANYQELKEGLNMVFRAVQAGEIKPMVLPKNVSMIGGTLRNMGPHFRPELAMEGLGPLRMLAEIGLVKLQRDLVNIFVGLELASQEQLMPFLLHPPDLAEAFGELVKLQGVLDLVMLCKTNLHLPIHYLSGYTREALKYFANCERGKYIHKFRFPLKVPLVRVVLENMAPMEWTASLKSRQGNYTAHTITHISTSPPFDHLLTEKHCEPACHFRDPDYYCTIISNTQDKLRL